MNTEASNPLSDYAAFLERHRFPHYIPPIFRIDSKLESAEQIRFESLVERLSRTLPETWFLRGMAGAGKTSLINALAAELSRRNVACVRVTPELIRHAVLSDSVASFVTSQAPSTVVDKVWSARTKRSKIVLLVDGVNEIRREWSSDRRWDFGRRSLSAAIGFP